MLTPAQCYLLLALGVAVNAAIYGYAGYRLWQIGRPGRALARYLMEVK